MEIANIELSLAGDDGNTVMKYGVTAAEIAVLRAIHGESSVKRVLPVGTIDRSNRDELARLGHMYGRATDGNLNSVVKNLFPGAAARVFDTIEELQLPIDFFAPEVQVAMKAAAAEAEPEVVEVEASKAKAGKKSAKTAEKVEPVIDDGIKDMDNVLG